MVKVAQIIGKCVDGGVESTILNLYRNIDHSKIAFDFFIENESKIINQKTVGQYGGKIHIIPSYKHIFKFVKQLKQIFKKEKYDIVHSNLNAQSFLALYAAKKSGIKVRIAHSHTTSNKKEGLRHLIKSCLRVFSKKYATDYIACSEKAGRWLFGNKLFDNGEVLVVNNGIDLDKYRFNPGKRNEIRAKLGISDSTKIIGHIGRFMPQKNHQFLVKIFNDVLKIMPDSKLIFLGTGPKEKSIKKLVTRYKIQDRVLFLGTVENAQDYYSAFDCFVLPSLYEGLPVVGVEAQANGLNCLFSNKITTELNISNNAKFLDIKDAKVWAKEISSILKDNTARNSGEVSDTFNSVRCSKVLENKYLNATNDKKIIFAITSLVRSGAEKVVVSLAHKYLEKGYFVSIVTLLTHEKEIDVDEQITIIDFAGKHKSRLLRVPYWLSSLKRYFRNNKGATIVSRIARINNLVLLCAKKKNHKIIVTEANDPRHDSRNFLTKFFVKHLYPKASKVVFQTEESKLLFTKKIQKNGVVIPNPVSISKYASLQPGDMNEIISAGRLAKQKDFITLIRAIELVSKKHHNVHLTIYGVGEQKQMLLGLVSSLNIGENVTINDNIPNIREKILDSFIYVSSSLYEGMSNSLLEASLSGIPCVVTPCLGTGFIRDGFNGYFYGFKDYQKLSEILIQLFNNNELYNKIRLQSIEYAKSKPFKNSFEMWEEIID